MFLLGEKLDRAREIISNAFSAAERPVVLWSAGKDSQLLLALVRETHPDTHTLWYRSDLLPTQRRFAERIIREWDLTVYGYAPADRYLLPNGDGLALVNEYSVDQSRLPVIVDVEDADRCVLDLSSQRTPFFSYEWDVTFTGWKACDTHPVIGRVNLDGVTFGKTRLVSPLTDFSDAEVWQALKELGIPFDENRYAGDDTYNPDVLHACTRCLQRGEGEVFCPKADKLIPRVEWQPEASLAAFRARFGYKEAA